MHDNIYRIVSRLCDRGHNNKSDRIMEENSMVRDLITKILDESGPSEGSSSSQSSDKTLNPPNAQYLKNDGNLIPPTYNYQNNLYNFTPEQNSFNYNGFNTNGFGNYPENDINILGVDQTDSSDVTPEQLNLLRLAAQEIGGAQFTSPNNEKFYNFFEPNQRTSLPETNMFQSNFNRPNSLNLDLNYQNNTNFDNQFVQRPQESDLLSYLSNLHISNDRRDDNMTQNMDFKMPHEINGHFNEDKMMYNRNVQPPKYNEFFMNNMMQNQVNPNFDFANQTPVSGPNMTFKPNGFRPEYIRNVREFHGEQRNYDNREMKPMTLARRNQELARQMSLLMRNQPPPNQLNVDVSFLHENAPFNLGLGTMLGPSPPVPPPVLPSPMLDMPLLAPFYAMRNMRTAATSSAILHARLDVCYEQWRQLERERKRTEARLALAYPGRAVSSSNSIPVPRLPPAPTRVDRLTVDMLREHTKVLTLMGKMETLRASVCVAHNKKANKSEDAKITVLKRGQENVEKEGVDPANFEPASWRDDVNNLAEIAPHSEVESAMLSWRASVCGVQCARQRELARPSTQDPILQLAEAVKQLSLSARRARTAMWCDLTLTVALATEKSPPTSAQGTPSKQNAAAETNNVTKTNADTKEEKTPDSSAKTETKTEASKTQTNKQTDKQEKNNQRRTQYFRHKPNQGRNDFYPKNQRYETRFMNHRHPYHYLATGPIN